MKVTKSGGTFFLKRLVWAVFVMGWVSLVAFGLMSLCPGDFLSSLRANPDLSADYVRTMEVKFGLDRPWIVQYVKWLGEGLRLNFGYSWTYQMPVLDLVGQRLGSTLILSLVSLTLSWGMAIPLGLAAAVWRNTWWDRWIGGLSYVFLSIPEFFLALLAVFFAAQTGWFPTSGRTSLTYDFLSPVGRCWDSLWHLFLPASVLGLSNVARLLRLTRGYVLDFLRAEFVTAARAKGVSEVRIILRHVLPNALSPLITHFGFALAGLLSGSLLVENVFNYPGLGQLLFEAFISQDQFVVMASIVAGGAMLMFGNLVADLLLMGVDPRIRGK